MINLFVDVALGDPLSLVLIGFGGLFIGSSVAVFGYLALRGVLAWIGGRSTAGPPTQAQ